MSFVWFLKKVHWSDTDAAGIAWFPNFLGWFEDAEEELYVAVLGRTRQSLLDELAYAMPRVEASVKYRAPVRAGQVIRIGVRSVIENPRRLRHEFEILARLGAGGMGEVYRARDHRLGRDVAIKVLPPAVAADADRVRRFEAEARAMNSLTKCRVTGYDSSNV